MTKPKRIPLEPKGTPARLYCSMTSADPAVAAIPGMQDLFDEMAEISAANTDPRLINAECAEVVDKMRTLREKHKQ